jgi:hypothetical protein
MRQTWTAPHCYLRETEVSLVHIVTIRHYVPHGPLYLELSAHLDCLPLQGYLDCLHYSTLYLYISLLYIYFFPLFSMLSFLLKYYYTI